MSANIVLCETGYYRSACVECQRRKQKVSTAECQMQDGASIVVGSPAIAETPSCIVPGEVDRDFAGILTASPI